MCGRKEERFTSKETKFTVQPIFLRFRKQILRLGHIKLIGALFLSYL